MKFYLLSLLALLLIPIIGCQARGHRIFTIELFGNTFSVEDNVINNTDGEDKYSCGFDEDSSVVQWLFGDEKNMSSNKEE